VTGIGTSFLTQVGIGDRIIAVASGESQYVAAIASDSSITVASPFVNSATNSAFTLQPSLFRAETSSGNLGLIVSDSVSVGVGVVNPLAKLSIAGTDSSTNGVGAAIRLKNSAVGGGTWNLRAGATGNKTPAAGFSIADSSDNYRLAIDSTGNVGIGTTTPGRELEVNGGVKLNTVAAQPTCNASNRGTMWFTQGGTGVKDALQVCAKDAADAYAWRTLY
jgi:hypothetical protein